MMNLLIMIPGGGATVVAVPMLVTGMIADSLALRLGALGVLLAAGVVSEVHQAIRAKRDQAQPGNIEQPAE